MANQTLYAATKLQANLRQLRGFTGTGFPTNNDDRVRGDSGGDLVLARADRQRLGKGDLSGHLRQPLLSRQYSGGNRRPFLGHGCASLLGPGFRGWR